MGDDLSRSTSDEDEHFQDDESVEDTRDQELSDDEIADEDLESDDFFDNEDDEFIEGSEFASEDDDTSVDDDDEKDGKGDQKNSDTADDDPDAAGGNDEQKDKGKVLSDEEESYQARYKHLQGHSTKVSQENASLRAEVTALKEMSGSENVQAFSQSEFERIQDEEGVEKAFAYRDAIKEKEIKAKLHFENRQKEIQEGEESRNRDIERFVDDHSITDAEVSEMVSYKTQFQGKGYELDPGALLVLQRTGSFESALKLIAKGKKAGSETPGDGDGNKKNARSSSGKRGSASGRRRRPAPVPRSTGRSSGAKKSVGFAGTVDPNDF